MSSKLRQDNDKRRKEIEKAVEETIIDTMKRSWLPNSIAWVAVVLGAFLINLLVLVLLEST